MKEGVEMRIILPCFITCLLLSTQSSAELIDLTLSSSDEQLTAFSQLQSLRYIHHPELVTVPDVHELKNKFLVRSLFVESNDLPMIDIQLTFNAGSSRDQEIGAELYGLANMAAQLMDEGTTKYSAEEIISTFESVGAKLSVTAYKDMFVVKLRVLSDPEKYEPALAMMLEVLKQANFRSSGIQLVLSNTEIGQKQLKENPGRMKNIVFYRSLYAKHPYAEPTTGTQASIRKIRPKDLVQFRKQFLVRNNLNIAITGNLTVKQAQRLAEKITDKLPAGIKAPPLPAPIVQSQFNIRHIPYPSSQAHVVMGEIVTTRHDPDYLALQLANRIFGSGGFNSILSKELRVKRGLTYGAYSNFSFMQVAGPFSLGYSTEQQHLLETIQIAHKALVDFVNQPMDPKQFEEAKQGLLLSFPNSYSSNAAMNAQLGSMGFYGLPSNYLNQYSEQLSKLTIEQVQHAVRKHLHPDRLTLVIFSSTLDKTKLNQILNLNLTSNSALPEVRQAPAIDELHPPKPETPSPVTAPHDRPALISNNDQL